MSDYARRQFQYEVGDRLFAVDAQAAGAGLVSSRVIESETEGGFRERPNLKLCEKGAVAAICATEPLHGNRVL